MTYESGVLETGDAVTCVVDGQRIGARVPRSGEGVAGVADGAEASAEISVFLGGDGRVIVRCGV